MTGTECITLKMGLFLFCAGPVRPTQPAMKENRVPCTGANNQSYICEFGHCCGESQCCSQYYELWWFWLVWAIIIILSCCCVCHHRRTKHRLQQQQRQHEINLIAYREAHNYTSLPFYFRFLPNYLLPDYEEVVNRPPTPPPPYSALNSGQSAAASPLTPEQPDGLHPSLQATPVPLVSETHSTRRSTEELYSPSTGFSHKTDSKPPAGTDQDMASTGLLPPLEKLEEQGDCHKGTPLRDSGSESCPEDKEGGPSRRHRRFTGDSGIEVCLCSREAEPEEQRVLEGLLGDGQYEITSDFCDGCASCSRPTPREAEQAPQRGPDHGVAPVPRPPPVSLLLHTISEQDGPHQASHTGPQS
ncbi:hypothetical protein AGOR_G00098880 [Albula goreensis]|uniref:WW domain binding protein 1-like n=1 Tax=Albula goreensis TaxID=1534307 RepID=A0A8T3DPE4_9TELE|nr:hypothetical protein AGOR_G00098880 [Albula goreensis]